MNKLMRKAPAIIAAIFLIVQISGLAAYANQAGGMDELRAMLFALALEAGIFGAAYATRFQPSKNAAIVTLILFLAVSGFLNTAKSWRDLPAEADDLARISAVLFGIVPSLFATVLGALQSHLAKLPPLAKPSNADTLPMRVYAIAEKALALVDARLSAGPANDAKSDHAGEKQCPQCKRWVHNLGSHTRWEHPKAKR